MQDTLTSIVAAVKILRKENKESHAIAILEDSIKQLSKLYIMDMSSISGVIGFEQVEEELRNGLKLLRILSEESEKNALSANE